MGVVDDASPAGDARRCHCPGALPVNAILQDLPLPAHLAPWPKAPPTSLTKCVALALLLHVWLVLLLGNAPGGTAQQGQGVWGAINVTLRGPATAGVTSVPVPAAPATPQPGDAVLPRWGGAVRSAEPLPEPDPGAARLGAAAPRVVPGVAPLPDAPALAAPLVVPAAPVAVPAAPGRVQEERAAPPPLPMPPLPAPPFPAPPLPEPAAAEGVLTAPALRSAPALQPALPSTPSLPSAAALPALPAPNAVIATLRPERQLVSPLTQPPSAAATAPLPRLAAQPALPELAAPAALADMPPAERRLQAAPQPSAPAVQPALARPAELPPLPVLAPVVVPGAGPPMPYAADAGAQVGHDMATPPAAAASAAPRLNLELSRPRGGELSRFSSRGVLPVLPRPPERDEKLAREIEKAGKTDCRNAHTGLGLLAVIPLAVEALRKDGGCKW